jgi:ABC-2 type transport system permease protein
MQLVGERLPSFLLSFAISPIVAIIYVLMARGAGRPDLEAFVVLSPMAVGLWGTATLAAGEAISSERANATLELLVAAPLPPAIPVIGRITASIAMALISVPETLLVARLAGVHLTVADPIAFAAGVLALAFSSIAVGLITASTYVLANGARLFSNLLGFPFFILAGVAFPITVLPNWIQPLSSVVSMTWAVDLLRRSATQVPGEIFWRDLGMTVVLGVVYFAIGFWLLRHVERRVRFDGTIGNA